MCKYCNPEKLNLLIESEKYSNLILFYASRNSTITMDDLDEQDNSVVLEVRCGQGYLRLGDRADMQCIDHDEKIEIDYCPMCGRDLTE